MPAFDTPGPIAATVVVAGAQVRVTASDRADTVVLVEPIDEASKTAPPWRRRVEGHPAP